MQMIDRQCLGLPHLKFGHTGVRPQRREPVRRRAAAFRHRSGCSPGGERVHAGRAVLLLGCAAKAQGGTGKGERRCLCVRVLRMCMCERV